MRSNQICRAGKKIVNGLCVYCNAGPRDQCGLGPEVDFHDGQQDILRRLREPSEAAAITAGDGYVSTVWTGTAGGEPSDDEFRVMSWKSALRAAADAIEREIKEE